MDCRGLYSTALTLSLSKGADMLSFWVYMRRCADGSYYVGHTDDLALRIAQH